MCGSVRARVYTCMCTYIRTYIYTSYTACNMSAGGQSLMAMLALYETQKKKKERRKKKKPRTREGVMKATLIDIKAFYSEYMRMVRMHTHVCMCVCACIYIM